MYIPQVLSQLQLLTLTHYLPVYVIAIVQSRMGGHYWRNLQTTNDMLFTDRKVELLKVDIHLTELGAVRYDV